MDRTSSELPTAIHASPFPSACRYCTSSWISSCSRRSDSSLARTFPPPPHPSALALIPSARSAAVSICLGPDPIPTLRLNSGRHRSSQSRGGLSRSDAGSLSFLYAISVHPHRYGTPYIAGLAVWSGSPFVYTTAVVFGYRPGGAGGAGADGYPVLGSLVASSLHAYGSRAYHSF